MGLGEILLPSIEGLELDFEESTVTLGTTKVTVAKYNPKRAYLLIMNISDTACRISTKSTVTTSKGLPLAQNTGNATFEYIKHGNLSIQEWYGISSGASKDLTILEGFIKSGKKGGA